MKNHEVHYKIGWRSKGNFPGHHPSQQPGSGLQFRSHVNLIDAPDPRRFDIRASIRDPFEQLKVRVYQQTSSIPVFVVADLSASMDYAGAHHKRAVLADLVEAISYSAYRTGDTFGFYGGSDHGQQPIRMPPTFNRAAGIELGRRLRSEGPAGRDVTRLEEACGFVGSKRALVFLVSDFHFPLRETERIMASLAYHDVVPVVVWDRHEFERLPRFGLLRIVDAETRQSRLLLMRGSLKRRLQENFAARRQELTQLLLRHGRAPLMLLDGFQADEVSRYFLS
ncbi:MAG: DUF58 domain-containing protein [Gammaproteobacteria bacterium]